MATIPVVLPGKFHGQRNLEVYSPWGHKELDMAEHAHIQVISHGFLIRIKISQKGLQTYSTF